MGKKQFETAQRSIAFVAGAWVAEVGESGAFELEGREEDGR